jgi:PAS domain S-box-containing protein
MDSTTSHSDKSSALSHESPIDPVVVREKLEAASKLRLFHWAVILASLLLSIIAWRFADSILDSQSQARFEREANQTVELVKERLRNYEDALQSGVAMINASNDDVSFETWERFATGIRLETKYPGINGIGVIHAVPKTSASDYLGQQRETRPNFKIHPAHEEDELFPISYIVPVKGNEKAVGLDIAHEKNRYTAARLSRDTGLSQITGPITLVQDKQKTPGFLFYAPLYKGGSRLDDNKAKDNFIGLVYAPFVVNKLMQGTLEKEKRHVGIRLLDGKESLYDEHSSAEPDFDPDPRFKQVSEIELYGRTWTFDIWSTKSFRAASFSSQPILILLGGILIDCLLLALFVSVSRSSKMALRFADSTTHRLAKKKKLLEESNKLAISRTNELEKSHKAVNEANAKMQGIIDNCRNFVGVLTKDGRIIEANHSAMRAVGVSSDEVYGLPFVDTPWWQHSEELQERLQRAIASAADGKPDGFEATHPTPDGSTIQVDFTIRPVFDAAGNVVWLIPEGKDITHHKLRENELLRLNEEVRRSNEELEQFAQVASHDLQEPLRKVASYCDLLEDEYGDQLGEEGRGYIHIAIDGARRMRTLVQDLLAFSKINSKHADENPVAEVDAAACFQSALYNLQVASEEANALIYQKKLPRLFVEKRHLTQMFQNLIGNSIKYRSEKQLEIRVEAHSCDHEWLFTIEDNGIGIDPQFHQRIFGIFKRLHNRQEYEGTGIGLAICQRIAERWNGKIWVDPNYDQGCKICFTVPKEAPSFQTKQELIDATAV